MTCLLCKHCDLQKNKDHARAGLGHCNLESDNSRFFALSHSCEKFSNIETEKAVERRAWNDKRLTTPRGHLAGGGALISAPMTEARAQYLRQKAERAVSKQKAIDSLKPAVLNWGRSAT